MKYLKYFLIILAVNIYPQDSTVNNKGNDWSEHFQETTITQFHPSFNSLYNGANSMSPDADTKTSLTSTLFLGRHLWKNAEAYFNIEVAGGEGFNGTTGAAGFPNGEVYRIGNPAPEFSIARFYIKQIFALSGNNTEVDDDENQIKTMIPDSYLSLTIGKFSMADFFDNNKYANSPRTQFLNWSLMNNGAWDYPANTKGYTFGAVGEFKIPEWAFRISTAMVAKTPNGMNMEYNIRNDHSETLEIEHSYKLFDNPGIIRTLFFLTHAGMGNYYQAVTQPWAQDNIDNTHAEGRTKYGLGINLEQNFSAGLGAFLRIGWNDGKNETWMFTEIDRTFNIGINASGKIWNRNEDNIGIALGINQLSDDHKNYLKAGGYGFIIGDGNINYSPETIFEMYYSLKIFEFLYISPDYQFILNPSYNKDRGPINVFSARMHIEI